MLVTKRQKEILNFSEAFIAKHGYAPSIADIRQKFGISSPATVHQHLKNLQEKGLIKREPNRHRSIEIIPSEGAAPTGVRVPILGAIAAGLPIESYPDTDTMALPEEMGADDNSYLLRVRGDSMIDDHILDGDMVLVRKSAVARPGQTVVALVDGREATLKRFYVEGAKVRLQPANQQMAPMYFEPGRVRIQGIVTGIIRKF
ncbi:MAG: transcriptional repressor LexA [Nitrospinae bacterium]|nr:transcriptional repressor LexA [Nitrospinota bacterium]